MLMRKMGGCQWVDLSLRSIVLLLVQGRYATAFLTLTTRSQEFRASVSESVQIPCEFDSDDFTMFQNPIIWKKYQNREETPINIMGNILDPLLATNRFEVSLISKAPRYQLALHITNLSPEDSGNYTCEIRGPRSAILAFVVHSLAVLSPVERIYLEVDNATGGATDLQLHDYRREMQAAPSDDDDDSTVKSLVFMEGVTRKIRCVSLGGYPLPEIRVFLGNKEITGMFQLTSSVTLEGTRGLRLIKYRTERTTVKLAFTAHDDELPISCVVTVPGIAANRTHVNINVLHRPLILCPSVVAHLGDQDVALRCEVRARPRLVALFWVIDGNGTTLTEGKTYNEYWTMVVDRSDGVMETRLFMRRVFRQSFRKYTLIAENSVAVSVAEAQLVQGTRSAKEVQHPDPPGNLALNDGSRENDSTFSRSPSSYPELSRFSRVSTSILTQMLVSQFVSQWLT